MLAFEFCQIFVTLGRIFSCSHDRDHIHQHIHANSYTVCYAKHVIHPPNINTPKSKEISLLVFLQKGERGHWKKREYMLKKHRKKCVPIKEHRKKWNMTPLQNKRKRRISKQGVLRKTHKYIPHTCTSRSSCMTSFFLYQVFGSTTSCGTSESHTYPSQSSTFKP
jgi:hypothetical protein